MNAAEGVVLGFSLAFLLFALLAAFGPDILRWKRERTRFWSEEAVAAHEARWERRPKPGPGRAK